ncbi:Mini-chromosome maintenance complex-binding protein [Linum grandiflorum]
MVGPMYDFLANPLGAVRLTFEKAVGSGGDPSTFIGKDWGALDVFHEFLFDQGNLSQVPVLNHETLRWVQPNTLVRFRGMVQDMLGNEFYVGAHKDGELWRTNKFADVCPYPIDSSTDVKIWERRLVSCVPVPGLSSWAECETPVATCMDLESQQRDKRPRTDAEPMDCEASDVVLEDSPSAKRMREEGHTSPSVLANLKSEGKCSSTMFRPEVSGDSFSCLVKVYDCPESELKLNDVFEFVGVFTVDSDPVPLNGDGDDVDLTSSLDNDMIRKVPCLHCIIHRKLAVSDFMKSSSTIEQRMHLVKDTRGALLRHLTMLLGNDGLAAHYMLLHLLSRVHARVENAAIGKLSLNLTSLNKETLSVFGAQLSNALKNLLPFTNSILLTVDYLNNGSLAPKKDYQKNRLTQGTLQLAEGSHLTIDETRLQSGTLNSVGIENARLLKNLTELQKVEYDFTYYKMEMSADVQLLILSEGKSNILPADIVLPVRPTDVCSPEAVSTDAMEAWRWYLASARTMSHSIELEMQEVVERDLVAARQADRSIGSEEFSRMLTMGRLMSLSFGEKALTLEHWEMVKELERLRKERLN